VTDGLASHDNDVDTGSSRKRELGERVAEVGREIETGGLTAAAAAVRLREEGPNTVAPPPPRRLSARILRQLADPLVALLIAAAAVTTALGEYANTFVIALVVTVNTTIGVLQEVRADRAIAALDRLAAPTARVVRDGRDAVLPAADLVRGDLVRLEPGDVVPADLRLHQAYRLQLDESALTGESVPVGRGEGDEAYAGTVVVTGRAAGTVVRTGTDSALGRITALVAATRPGPTPLQRRLASLGRVLGAIAVALSALIFALGVIRGQPVADMAITAVSLVVAAVPESLPAVVTLALALGARRMARSRAIPRRLHAVETLGSVTVVASDKTGTLTEGRMAAQQAVTMDGAEYAIAGTGYEPSGEIVGPGGEYPVTPPPLVELARAGLLCNDATLSPPGADGERWTAIGDPLEAALVAFAARCGLDPAAERADWPRIAEEPFEQSTRRMTTVHRGPHGDFLIVCKGAPESVLQPPVVRAGPPAREAVDAAHALAADGLRVLAVAADLRDAPGVPARPVGLRPLGLIAVGDPLRDTAPAIADAFAAAGIRLVLVTGDHPATAAAIGGRLGLMADGDEVVRGDAMRVDGKAVSPEHADRARVFARIQPDQKLDIVAALQRHGHVVAMTGDGVNDAPALRRADIGVAMGGGTEVARQAADLVLVDDNLGTVATAVREGRRIYDNIRRFLRYSLSGGAAEILVMLAGPAAGLAVPLLPAQILWINLLTHGLPGVALGAEPAERGIMRRPPRSPQESVLGGGLSRAVLITGTLIAAATLGTGVAAYHLDRPWQSMVFMVLGLAQLGVALQVRARRRAGTPGNPGLLYAIVLSALLQVAGVLLPPLRGLLGTDPLGAAELLACAAVATLPALGARLLIR
jgi:Ca2+-transporting ATPase